MKAGALICAVVVVVLATACSTTGGPSPAPSADPTAAATAQVTRFFDLLKARDIPGLDAFLSPAFQLQRADGTGAGKLQYLGIEPANIISYQISDLRATQDRDILIARYFADVEGTVNNQPYAPGPAPRLSAFHWTGSDWQLIAHANFDPLAGPSPSPQ